MDIRLVHLTPWDIVHGAFDAHSSHGRDWIHRYSSGSPIPTVRDHYTKLPVATVAKYYKAQIELSGGIGPYSFSITEGRLPNGLSMSSSGVVSGIPTYVADGAIVVEATDSV